MGSEGQREEGIVRVVKWLGGVVLVSTLLVVTAFGSSVEAQQSGGTKELELAEQNNSITIPLTTVTANQDGTGSASTTLPDVTLDQLFDQRQERIIVFHAKQEEGVAVPPPIACADVNPTPGETTTKTERTVVAKERTEAPLPKSGGPVMSWAPSVLLPAAVLVLGFGVLAFAVLRRR